MKSWYVSITCPTSSGKPTVLLCPMKGHMLVRIGDKDIIFVIHLAKQHL